MRILLVGGSFNPVHIGHVATAREVGLQFGYDLMLFVPSLRPPHKRLAEEPGPNHRLAMLRLAAGDDAGMAVDDCEITRGGTSFTIDTVRDIATRYAIEGKLGLLLGDDLIPGFPSWKDPALLASEADIICAHRKSVERLPLSVPHRYADNPVIAVSSSLVRERIAHGQPFRHLVPESVYEYIIKEKLYGLH
ncbi:MAG TPA: nicotinate (nicotinamide) nucleotide adenylyltransferase [Rectinemataceae bacterium]|nr:nicotinate (nicotinamide) nucleotide adenylyltransferase [Rectinemataceae bacterium]